MLDGTLLKLFRISFLVESHSYVSSDFGNHPLSHLMGSVFGMHNRENVEVLLLSFKFALVVSSAETVNSLLQ
jgi:hypothetical protein